MQAKSRSYVLYIAFFSFLILLLLTHSQTALYYALNGLDLWFENMIPTLMPFMILSGVMIRLGLTEGVCAIFHPVLDFFFHIRKNVSFAILTGFFCGFPMGAKVTADLLERGLVTQEEGEFLLSFCNNIGPIYFISFALPLLERKLKAPYLFGMYGLPLLYGLFLRHTKFRGRLPSIDNDKAQGRMGQPSPQQAKSALAILEDIDDSIQSAIQSILTLGGYMVLFNLLNLVPDALGLPCVLAPVLEITGGLKAFGASMPFLSLVLLPFGGLSCIAQTYSIIRPVNLSFSGYVANKLILTVLTALYYLGWALLSPATFLA